MSDIEDKKLKVKTFLNTYCPHCKQSFNVENKDSKLLVFNARYKGQEMKLQLSPYLDAFEAETTVAIEEGEVLEDLLCPFCKKSLVHNEIKCGECGSPWGK